MPGLVFDLDRAWQRLTPQVRAKKRSYPVRSDSPQSVLAGLLPLAQ